MATINKHAQMLETMLSSICPDPYEAMLVLDLCKTRYLIYTTQKQMEGRENGPTENISGDERGGIRTVQDDREVEQEVPGGGPTSDRGRLKRRGGEASQPATAPTTRKPATEESRPGLDTSESASGQAPGARNYRIPRPGDPDYVAPAARDGKPQPVRPGEEIPFAVDPLPDPTDEGVLVRGKGKAIACGSCATRAYVVSEDMPQTMTLLSALALFEPEEGFKRISDVAQVEVMENGSIATKCPLCNANNSIVLVPRTDAQ